MRYKLLKSLTIIAGMLCLSVQAHAQTQRNPCYYQNTTSPGTPGNGCEQVSPFSPLPVTSAGSNGAPAGAMQSNLAVTTGAVVTPTVPTGTVYMVVCIRAANTAINFSDDGLTTPTTGASGAGRQLNPGTCIPIVGSTLIANFKAIAATATTAIDVEYDR